MAIKKCQRVSTFMTLTPSFTARLVAMEQNMEVGKAWEQGTVFLDIVWKSLHNGEIPSDSGYTCPRCVYIRKLYM